MSENIRTIKITVKTFEDGLRQSITMSKEGYFSVPELIGVLEMAKHDKIKFLYNQSNVTDNRTDSDPHI